MSSYPWILSFLTCIFLQCICTEGQWISSSDWFLPQPDFQMSIGAYNDILTILGGNYNPLDMTIYEISNDLIIPLPTNTMGTSQYWTQIQNIVLLMDPYSPVINSYDLSTSIFTQKWKGITIPNNVTIYTGCIASTQDTLFIVGGADEVNDVYLDTLFIYYLNSDTWDHGASISPPRSRHSCIVSEWSDQLYVIGGQYRNGQTRGIQYISVNNTAQNTWTTLQHNLEFRSDGVRSVSYDKYIYIISGGDNEGTGIYLNTVHIIDAETNTLSVAQHSLVYGVSYSAPVIVQDRLYVFGGRITYGVGTSRLQYLDLLPTTPTPTSSHKHTTEHLYTQITSYPRIPSSYNFNATSISGDITTTQLPIVASLRFWIIIVVGSVNIILFVFCMHYIVTQMPTRSRDSKIGNASFWKTLKSITVVDYLMIGLEIFDIATDYLYATSLIVSNHSYLIVLGWLSLMFSICGLVVLFSKYSAFRKLIASQVNVLKEEAAKAKEDDERDEKMKQIRARKTDIHIISLLNGTVEDVPQTLIVLIATWSHSWSYISILKITCAMVSFASKLCMIVLTYLGCCDPTIQNYYEIVIDDDNEL
eukprot:819902_1